MSLGILYYKPHLILNNKSIHGLDITGPLGPFHDCSWARHQCSEMITISMAQMMKNNVPVKITSFGLSSKLTTLG